MYGVLLPSVSDKHLIVMLLVVFWGEVKVNRDFTVKKINYDTYWFYLH